MKKKYSEEEIKIFRYGMSHAGMFGIVYKEMAKNKKEPFGKDIDEYFNNIEIMRKSICKSPRVKRLYKGTFN